MGFTVQPATFDEQPGPGKLLSTLAFKPFPKPSPSSGRNFGACSQTKPLGLSPGAGDAGHSQQCDGGIIGTKTRLLGNHSCVLSLIASTSRNPNPAAWLPESRNINGEESQAAQTRGQFW